MKVVSYTEWSLNAGSIWLIYEGLLYLKWSLKACGLLIQVVYNTGLTEIDMLSLRASYTAKLVSQIRFYLVMQPHVSSNTEFSPNFYSIQVQ